MRLLRVQIERFRGIKSLDWFVNGEFVCLIGPGDSTKTTILDAIELALSPRWSVPFDDTDFYDADTLKPFTITVTVGELPAELKSDRKFGHHARGWLAPATLHDEPEKGDEVVLSIRLQVPSSLEPTWAVVNDRDPDGVRIAAEDREKLGCTRLGEFLDRHFSWARGSVVAQLTGKTTGITGVLAEVTRAARSAIANAPVQLKQLNDAASEAERVGKSLGVRPRASYQARLDTTGVSLGSSGLSLHDGDIPFRRAGAGTRRLLAVAIQRELAKTGGLTLIDEVEHGLEPHRLRHLLRELRAGPEGKKGHVVMTTHAPVALGELAAEELRVVRCDAGVTKVQDVGPSLQHIVLKSAEAFLARKVIVCEGKTELGLVRGLAKHSWASDPTFVQAGLALTDNGGGRTVAPPAAVALAGLGYATAYLGDTDEPLQPDAAALRAAGCEVILWGGAMALEARLVADLPWSGVAEMVQLAIDLHGDASVRDAIAARAGVKPAELVGPPIEWTQNGLDEEALRRAISYAAQKHERSKKAKGWFKRVDYAEDLASIVISNWESLAGKDVRIKLEQLQGWVHA